LNYTKWWSQN